MARVSKVEKVELVQLDPPFSNFDFADKRFGGSFPIRRLFSQARARKCLTLLLEEIEAFGPVADENKEIQRLFPQHEMRGLVRLSFWKRRLRRPRLSAAKDEDCVGYAILKRDFCPRHPFGADREDYWHIFEAVFSRPEHRHNYTPSERPFRFSVGRRQIQINGVLYGQQNGLNKACAQVALRSLCATYLGDASLTYSRINELAGGGAVDAPNGGLNVNQIRAVLKGFDIAHFDFDYSELKKSKKSKKSHGSPLPFQRLIYSGIESGTGALLGFSMSGPDAKDARHIIHCYGHTFNEDTWAAVADGDYFHVGEDMRYIPSDAWMGSFIAHDDNYGSNLCVPKTYLRAEHAQYAVALLPRGFCYNGIYAEAAASYYFYSLVQCLAEEKNTWLERLLRYAQAQKLILRVVPVSRDGYIAHLREAKDWQGNREVPEILAKFAFIPTIHLWMVEVSVPDLFSTNQRKVGELLLDASRNFETKADFRLFILARFPGAYLFYQGEDVDGEPRFLKLRSQISSHVAVLPAKAP